MFIWFLTKFPLYINDIIYWQKCSLSFKWKRILHNLLKLLTLILKICRIHIHDSIIFLRNLFGGNALKVFYDSGFLQTKKCVRYDIYHNDHALNEWTWYDSCFDITLNLSDSINQYLNLHTLLKQLFWILRRSELALKNLK